MVDSAWVSVGRQGSFPFLSLVIQPPKRRGRWGPYRALKDPVSVIFGEWKRNERKGDVVAINLGIEAIGVQAVSIA